MNENASLPLGVAVLAVLVGIFGAFLLLAGLVVTLVALFHIAATGWTTGFGTGAVSGLITLLFGAIILAVAFGLWDQELWALVLAIIAVGAAVVWFIVLPLYTGSGVGSVVNLPAIVSGILLIYLVAVSDHFY